MRMAGGWSVPVRNGATASANKGLPLWFFWVLIGPLSDCAAQGHGILMQGCAILTYSYQLQC